MSAGTRLAWDLRDRLPGWTMKLLPASAVNAAELRHPSYGWTLSITERAVVTVYVQGQAKAELDRPDAGPLTAFLDCMERQSAAHRDLLAGQSMAELESERFHPWEVKAA